jgi:hypothetical protein
MLQAMAETGGLPGADAAAPLRRLLHKYELLCWLTDCSAPGRTAARREALRTIAERFPAALREWEQQPAAEIERRRQQVAAQLLAMEQGQRGSEGSGDSGARGTAEAWLVYGLDLHDCLRALLRLRRYMIEQAGRRRAPPADAGPPPWLRAEGVLACAALLRDCEVPWLAITPELLTAVALPPDGRLAALAYQAVARRHGVSEAEVKAAIFGPRG